MLQQHPARRAVLVVVAQAGLNLRDLAGLRLVGICRCKGQVAHAGGCVFYGGRHRLHHESDGAYFVLDFGFQPGDVGAALFGFFPHAAQQGAAYLLGQIVKAGRVVQALHQVFVELGRLDGRHKAVNSYRCREPAAQLQQKIPRPHVAFVAAQEHHCAGDLVQFALRHRPLHRVAARPFSHLQPFGNGLHPPGQRRVWDGRQT